MKVRNPVTKEVHEIKAFSFGEGNVGNRRININDCVIVDIQGCYFPDGFNIPVIQTDKKNDSVLVDKPGYDSLVNQVDKIRERLDKIENHINTVNQMPLHDHNEYEKQIERLCKVIGYNYNKLIDKTFDFDQADVFTSLADVRGRIDMQFDTVDTMKKSFDEFLSSQKSVKTPDNKLLDKDDDIEDEDTPVLALLTEKIRLKRKVNRYNERINEIHNELIIPPSSE